MQQRKSTLESLVLIAMLAAGAPAIYATNVIVDASQSSPQVLLEGNVVAGNTTAVIDVTPDTPHRVQVAPGGFPGFVTVSASGTVSYDPSLEGTVFTGAGTNTLGIVAFPVTVDATDLTGSARIAGLQSPFPVQTITYGLPAGQYRLQGVPGGVHSTTIDVDTTGNISYDPSLEGTVYTGTGTSTVALVGHPITIESGQLDSIAFETILGGEFGVPATHTVTYRLPVGRFGLQASPGGRLDLVDIRTQFTVEQDGTVSYDPTIDGLSLAGLGTDTLEVLPKAVIVDATNSTVDANISFSFTVTAGASNTLALSVGTFNVNASTYGNIGSFSIDSDGSCSQDEFSFGGGVVRIFCSGACADGDGDGFGQPAGAACTGGSAEDCDDSNAGIYPGAIELPGNTVDEDCDGSLGACDPLADWRNHGHYVRCVAHEVDALVDAGQLTEEQGEELIKAAARSDVGKR